MRNKTFQFFNYIKNVVLRVYCIFTNVILNQIKDTGRYLKVEHFFGFINNDLSPKRCRYCGNVTFREKVTDKIDFITTEIESHCEKCNKINGYWCYGSWMP